MSTKKHASELFLYKREDNYIPRIGAVHDLCGYGKCSLGVAIPVLSAAGIDVCPVPTAFLSSHTQFAPYTFTDTTDELPDYLNKWETIGIELDGIYSGFLASSDQVRIIQQLGKAHPNALKIVDPVMADEGKIYPTYTPELCSAMGDLAVDADILTPNITEASVLVDFDYPGESPEEDQLVELMQRLENTGAKHIILKGKLGDDMIRNYIFGPDIETAVLTGPRLPYKLHGTGDLFCSAVIAAIFTEHSLYDSVDFAMKFVLEAMQDTVHQLDFEKRGISFELQMPRVAKLLND